MFDFTTEYEEKIRPMLEQINQMCVINGIPFFAACAVKDDGTSTTYRNVLNSAHNTGTKLADDQIKKHINVANGFETILKRSPINNEEFDLSRIPEIDIPGTEW